MKGRRETSACETVTWHPFRLACFGTVMDAALASSRGLVFSAKRPVGVVRARNMLASSLPARARVASSGCRVRLQQASSQLSSGVLGGIFGRTGHVTVTARAASSSSSREQPRTVPRAVSAPDAEAKSSEGKEATTAYPFKDVEKKWQAYWDAHKTFRTPEKARRTGSYVRTSGCKQLLSPALASGAAGLTCLDCRWT